MKKYFFILMLITPTYMNAQIGVKAGLNFAKVSNASSINSSNKSGFHAGVFFAPAAKVIGSRTELLFSRQGYNYKTSTVSGDVNLDYLQFVQFLNINITKYFSLMLGAQTSYLLSAKTDSSYNTGNSTADKFLDIYNRFDYGYSIGAEVHPVRGLILGARYNVSLANVYKDFQNTQQPSFTSENAKNNVVQISIGWRFGKYGKK